MAKAKDYSAVPDMTTRLDTSRGEDGSFLPRVAPGLYGADPEALGAVGAAQGGPLVDPNIEETLGVVSYDADARTEAGTPLDLAAAGSNSVAVFESGSEPNPSVPTNASGSVSDDGTYTPMVTRPTEQTTETTETTEQVEQTGDEDAVLRTEPTDEEIAAVDAEGNAEHVKALVVARGLAEPKTKTEAAQTEAKARLLEACTNEQLLGMLPNEGEGHKAATKAELVVLVLTATPDPAA